MVPKHRQTAPDPYAATPEKMLPFARALAGDVQASLEKNLTAPLQPAAVSAAAAASHQYYEQTWRYIQSLHVVPHACQAGCSHCCYLTVEASAPEIFLLADHLRAFCSAERLEEITTRVRRTAAAVQALSPAERVQARVPCALLENGKCQAYVVRPLGCRSWNSRDAGACAAVLRDGGGDLRPVQDQRPLGIEAGVREGFAEALQAAGLPAALSANKTERRCELNTALLAALEDSQAAARWLGGDDTLEAARPAVRYADENASG